MSAVMILQDCLGGRKKTSVFKLGDSRNGLLATLYLWHYLISLQKKISFHYQKEMCLFYRVAVYLESIKLDDKHQVFLIAKKYHADKVLPDLISV